MKKEADYTIIYDDQCPMCIWYTEKFVDMGTLKPNNRIGFGEAKAELMNKVIFEKASRGIPLIDNNTQEVTYGLESMLKLISARFPKINSFLYSAPVRWFFTPVYGCISYNRRVIAGAKGKPGNYDSKPPLHLPFRISYLMICLVGIMLPALSIFKLFNMSGHGLPALIITLACFSGFLVHAFVLLLSGAKNSFDYLGHLFTANFIAMFPLGVLFMLYDVIPPLVLVLAAIGAVVLSDLDYRRRYKNGHVPIESLIAQYLQVLLSVFMMLFVASLF